MTGKTRALDTLKRLFRAFDQCSHCLEVAECLLEALEQWTRADQLVYLDWDAQLNRYFPLTGKPALTADLESLSYYPVEGPLREMVHRDQPFAVTDAQGDPLYQEAKLILGLASRTWAPVMGSEGLTGIVSLNAHLNEDRTALVNLICSRAAEAMVRLGWKSRIGSLEEELNRRRAALVTFQEWTEALLQMEESYQQLESLLDRSRRLLDAERSSLMLLDSQTDELVIRAVRGLDPVTELKVRGGDSESVRLKLGQGVAGLVALTGEARVVQDISNDDDFVQPESCFADSLLCVPLKSANNVLGVLNFTNKKNQDPWTRQDVRRASRLARQAAQALDNGRLYNLAVKDNTTGLVRRDHFHQRLEQEVLRAGRDQRELTLCLVRVHNLSSLHRRLPEHTVNTLVRGVADVLRDTCRRTDTVGRLGEVTFGMIWPCCGTFEALNLEARLRRTIGEIDWLQGPRGTALDLDFASQTTHPGLTEPIALLTACYRRLRQQPAQTA